MTDSTVVQSKYSIQRGISPRPDPRRGCSGVHISQSSERWRSIVYVDLQEGEYFSTRSLSVRTYSRLLRMIWRRRRRMTVHRVRRRQRQRRRHDLRRLAPQMRPSRTWRRLDDVCLRLVVEGVPVALSSMPLRRLVMLVLGRQTVGVD